MNSLSQALKRRRRGALLSAVMGAGIIFTLFLRPTEPEYNGRLLGDWLELYGMSGSIQAQNVLANAGPEAVPYLNHVIRSSSRPFSRMYVDIWLRTPPWLRTHIPPPEYPGLVQLAALETIAWMGPRAVGTSAAIGELLLEEDLDAATVQLGIQILIQFGPHGKDAAPSLVRMLEDRQDPARQRVAAVLLASYTMNADVLLPHIERQLIRSTNAQVRLRCALAHFRLSGKNEALLLEIKNSVPAFVLQVERLSRYSSSQVLAHDDLRDLLEATATLGLEGVHASNALRRAADTLQRTGDTVETSLQADTGVSL